MSLFICLLKKEWLDSVRDKRAFIAAMVMAFVGPLLFAAMLMVNVDKSQSLEPIRITLEGAAHFPVLVEKLALQQIVTDDAALPDSRITVLIGDDFVTHINASEPATITIKADYADKSAGRHIDRIKQVLQQYANELVALRLMVRGIAPSVVRPLNIVEQDSSSAQSRAGLYLTMMSTFVLMSIFVASTNVAIDSSAGERERNSLEFLLAQPVQPLLLVLAKTLNTSFFSIIGGGLTLVLMVVALKFVPLHRVGVDFEFGWLMALLIWLSLIPLATFAAGLQLVTSFLAKTFKEAQSYLNMTIMLPMLLPMILIIADIEHPLLHWLPLTGQILMIADFVKGDAVNALALLSSSLGSLALAGSFVAIMSNGLKSEKMILGL